MVVCHALDRTSLCDVCIGFDVRSGGDGDDYTFELSKSSPSCGGGLTPGLNGTRIKGTIQVTFIRARDFFCNTPPGHQVLRWAE